MKRIDKVLQKIDDAYTAFKNDMLSLPPSELYDRAYKIFSIEEIYLILINGYDFTEEIANRILLFRGNVLEQIYEEWVEPEHSHQDAFRNVIRETLAKLPERTYAYET
ncbi:DUF3848 domain-containing protein [Acetivibrio sp. MSJd-27]|uniref:DUF3848 domain-containing protein n=1 Tax=Acetivibrio sp. MSJd-27 TaxID=2841523 RepID=UPI001C11207F|nr:DUF3848 domain-containing protein [Acetivibrio sp. MSJd-27]MBU5451208.1 DUF3848 domain-containing protein [Acetivibrio sp. MSJd-27]